MRSLLMFLCVAFLWGATTSCENETWCEENCGVITNDPLDWDANGNILYGLTIKNDCSGNTQTFYFTYETWLTSYVGDYFCISNVSSWKTDEQFDGSIEELRMLKDSRK